MKQKYLSKWLKIITLVTGVIGTIIYFVVIPILGSDVVDISPTLDFVFWPWVILIWITSIPCYIALVIFYDLCNEIGKDNSFSYKNAKILKQISWLAVIDSVFFFAGNIVFLLLNISHVGLLLVSLFIVFVGIAIGILAAALSHLVLNACEIKNENELTI